MNGSEIPKIYHCKTLLLPWYTNLEDNIYYVFDNIMKKEKLIEILTDINQFKLYMREIKINQIKNKNIINYKDKIKTFLMYFIYDNYNSITIIEENKI